MYKNVVKLALINKYVKETKDGYLLLIIPIKK